MEDLYNDNFKTLKKEIKGPKRWTFHAYGVGEKINIVQILAKEIFEFNVTPIKNLISLFIELEKIPPNTPKSLM